MSARLVTSPPVVMAPRADGFEVVWGREPADDRVRSQVPSVYARKDSERRTDDVTEQQALRVLVWGENWHEQNDPRVQEIYPDGMHEAIRAGIESLLGEAATVRTTTLDEPEHGLTQEVLDSTDVLIWWGHMAHDDVSDEVVDRVQEAVLSGMGLIALHSAHFSKIFRRLMGTSCTLRWRNEDDRELLWTVNPTHPIAAGVPHPLVLDQHEMYGEFFDIPAPDELIFISTFSGGEAFRSGATFRRGYGKVFYFSPGDQDYPIYHHPDVQRVIANGVTWAAPSTTANPAARPIPDRRLLRAPRTRRPPQRFDDSEAATA